jgi:hypothetical protein
MRRKWLAASLFFGALIFSVFLFNINHIPQDLIRIPIVGFAALRVPMIEVGIEGTQYRCGIDLGSSFELYLQPEILEKLENKTARSNVLAQNAFNIFCEPRCFSLDAIHLNNWKIPTVTTIEIINDFKKSAIICCASQERVDELASEQKAQMQGIIGRPIFTKFHSFFNIQSKEIVLGKTREALLRAGCSIEGFIPVPFTLEHSGIIFSITTGLGSHRYILDTGATFSMIRERLVDKSKIIEVDAAVNAWDYISNTTIYADHDFGSWRFRLFPMSDAIDYFDGVLGMDFFERHAIYLDFQNNMAYISP